MKVVQSKKQVSDIIIRGFVAVLALCTLLALVAMMGESQKTQNVTTATPPTGEELLRLVNEERSAKGVPALRILEQLNQSAQFKADDMNSRGYADHKDPSTNRSNGLDKAFEVTGQLCSDIGENLLDNTTSDNTSRQALGLWKSSESHYSAILSAKYVYTGFGISGTKVVQHFCTPK